MYECNMRFIDFAAMTWAFMPDVVNVLANDFPSENEKARYGIVTQRWRDRVRDRFDQMFPRKSMRRRFVTIILPENIIAAVGIFIEMKKKLNVPLNNVYGNLILIAYSISSMFLLDVIKITMAQILTRLNFPEALRATLSPRDYVNWPAPPNSLFSSMVANPNLTMPNVD